MKKSGIVFLFLMVIEFSFAQTRNIIIVNVCERSITNKTPKIEVDGIKTKKIVYKSFIIVQSNKDSVEIKVPDNTILKKKVNSFHFALKDKNNYFTYSYKGLIAVPIIEQVVGNDLLELKKNSYVQKNIKELNLE
jgi:hypothetical protein